MARRSFLRMCGFGLMVPGCMGTEEDAQMEATQLRSGMSLAVDVRKAKLGQPSLGDPERCSISQDLAWLVGAGEQLRIYRSVDEYAVYTVDQVCADSPSTVRMSLAGRQRLGASDPFSAILDTQVIASDCSDVDAMAMSEFVERRTGPHEEDSLIVLAPHGGWIELYTDTQADSLAEARGVGSWVCKGFRIGGGTHDRWHVTSTAIHPASFPELAQITGVGYSRAVAFHGMASPGVVVGGGAPFVDRQLIASFIANVLAGTGLPVTAAQPGDPLGGGSPDNLVNWLTASGNNGIQIEQSLTVRSNFAHAVVDAVAEALDVLG